MDSSIRLRRSTISGSLPSYHAITKYVRPLSAVSETPLSATKSLRRPTWGPSHVGSPVGRVLLETDWVRANLNTDNAMNLVTFMGVKLMASKVGFRSPPSKNRIEVSTTMEVFVAETDAT